jgi:hypothetical protein
MGVRKILGDVNKSYTNYLANSEAKYRAKQRPFLEKKAQLEKEIRKAEEHEAMKRGEPSLGERYIRDGSFFATAMREMREREDAKRKSMVQEPSSPSRSQLLKSRGTQSSATRKIIK